MEIIRKKAFTLVELIVTITILIVLWTIWFFSIQWYTVYSRDVVRITDLNNIRSTLEISQIETWKYVLPDNSVAIQYQWTTVWNQWTFWKTARKKTKI